VRALSDTPGQTDSGTPRDEGGRSRLIGWVARCAVLGAGYYIAGRLALLLAIPPGYAAPVWPAAGVALAGLLLLGNGAWPSIVIGSFFVNLFTAFDGSSAAAVAKSLSIAMSIGCGAALQAFAGASLIRRYAGFPNSLSRERDVYLFLAYGGPVSCLINAACGVATLAAAGLIPASEVLFSVGTWWVGDTIGFVLVAPALLIWLDRPLAVSLRRRLTVTAPLGVTLFGVVSLFIYASHREQRRIVDQFERQSDELIHEIQGGFNRHIESVKSVADLYASVESVDRAEFGRFARRQLERLPGAWALSWNPRVASERRAAFEASVRGEGFAGYEIRELDAQGRLVRAAKRAEYAPIAFIEPLAANRASLGFDLASDPFRRETLERARDRHAPSSVGPVSLLQDEQAKTGLVIFMPVYRNALPVESVEARRRNLRGYLGAVVRTQPAVEAIVSDLERVWGATRQGLPPIRIRISAGGDPGDATALYETAGAYAYKTGGLRREAPLSLAGRDWRIEFEISNAALRRLPSWGPWLILVTGLLISILLGIILLTATGRAAEIEEEVVARTKELKRSNEDLEQFAYVASHDIQEPLRMVSSYTALLARRYRGKLGADADEFIAYAVDGAERMQSMIRDLLDYARIGKQRSMQPTDCMKPLGEALKNLEAAVLESGAVVTFGPMPRLTVNSSLIAQLFQNLIGNAIKYRSSASPVIEVSAKRVGAEWRFSVADNGIGLDMRFAGRIFVIFQRLQTRAEYPGNGIGLAFCKRIVDQHGGRIWVESEPGRGSTFTFTLPVS